jgi:hypothetical protein
MPGKDIFLLNLFTIGIPIMYEINSVTFRIVAFMYLLPPREVSENIDP